MRKLRLLQRGVWYKIRTRVNNREPLFRGDKAPAIFARVFRETELRFVFEIRGLRLEDDWLTFYIKPENGLQLPAIMKWLKQTFAQRYNRAAGRIGHIWGDRYWSQIVEGDPAADVEGNGEQTGISKTGVRPHGEKNEGRHRFSPISPHPTAIAPG
jgi:REP element-mobilizing transposase RayT